MSVLPVGISGEAQYQISRSVRFNSPDSAYFSRTPSSAGNQKTWTWSGWVKRGTLTTDQMVFSTGNTYIRFGNGTTDNLWLNLRGAGVTNYFFQTTAVYRDPSAWYHIVLAVDTTQATSTNRVKLYVNNVQVTAFTTYADYPPQNTDTGVNSTAAHNLGSYSTPSIYFNGYMTEVNLIDGQALTPSSFGETDPVTGVWKPKKYTGTYGTNGFYLNFSDNSGTTSTTLGKDYSGNGNNWTPNNFSVTAGAGNDSLVDVPTLSGSDTGAGGEVRGNYATFNPLQIYNSAGGVISTVTANGNLELPTVAAQRWGGATIPVSTGKWYAEFVATIATDAQVGIYPSPLPRNVFYYQLADAKAYNSSGAFWAPYPTATQTYSSWTTGDIIGIALDLDNGKVWVSKNGTWQGGGSPSAGTSPAVSGLTGEWIIGAGQGSSGNVIANFGQRPFAYTAPSGFKALCTTNLPEPTINQGDDYFNAVTYTGNGSTQSITGVGFQPDWVWIKKRSGIDNHELQDAVRGATKRLASNTTDVETTVAGSITSFNSNGFSVGNAGTTNENGFTYVAWNWKANGTGVTNTAGTITSTVSANTTSGFSIVSFNAGSAGNKTVGHGLGVTPAMFIMKDRQSTSGFNNWNVWHKALSNSAQSYLVLNTTAASTNDARVWANTAPTSSVISFESNYGVAANNNVIIYAFAEVAGFSRFGSYTGNGSTDGPFVFTGFRPRYVLIKRATGGVANWELFDTARDTYNQMGNQLYANLSSAEYVDNNKVDFLSNGIKIRSNQVDLNNNGDTYVYACFAESPFKFSLAR